MHTNSQFPRMLEHHHLIGELTLRQCLFSVDLFILLRCSILRSLSSSNRSPLSHSKSNKFIQTRAFLVVHHRHRNICRISSNNRGRMAVASVVVGVQTCQAFLPPKTGCRSQHSSSRASTSHHRIKPVNLILRWVVKIVHQQLIVESRVPT